MEIDFDGIFFWEGEACVGYCPELDVSSCGGSVDEARQNLKTAVRLFVEEAKKLGTLRDILIEAGYKESAAGKWISPRLVATEVMNVPLGP
jgi:predicted RNase H-like HicB family nuclease